LRRGILTLVVAAVALSVGLAVPPAVQGQGSADVAILFDLGDGSYYWSRVLIPDRLATNASWDATLRAAGEHGLVVSHRWFPGLGIAVGDIGDRRSPAGFAGLFEWNGSAERWDAAGTGISSLVLDNGDAIAWSNAAYDSVDFSLRTPVPTVLHPNPALGFRGDGISGEEPGLQAVGTGTSASQGPNSASLLWETDLQTREIVSTPANAYGMVYVETFRGLYALDDWSGAIRWHNPRVKGFSSPAVFDGSVITGASDGRVYRLDAFDGTELWNTSLIAAPRFSGITSSPRVAFDAVYIGTFNESGGPGEVVSLWVSNGTVAWRHATGSVHFSSPAVLRGVVYVGVMGDYNTTTNVTFDPPYGVLALYASNGTERWFFPTGGPVAASPIVSGSRVIAPSRDGNLYGIRISNGTEAWRAAVGAGVSSPALFRDTIFVGGGDLLGSGRVTAVNRITGATEWTYVPNGPVQSSVTYADGKVFFSTNVADGTVYALNASSGAVVWSYRPAPSQYILGSPVVANGTLYAPSDNGRVYAFRDRGVPLATLVPAAGPLTVRPGDNASVGFVLGVRIGAISNARVNVTLPPGLDIASTDPSATRIAGRSAEWDVGTIPPPRDTTFVVRFLVPPVAGDRDIVLTAEVTYTDNDGTPYGPVTATSPVHISAPSVPGLAVSVLAWFAVGVGIAAVVLIVVLFLFWRRRPRAPP
jgi:outer membrane protein assembly factor BamB